MHVDVHEERFALWVAATQLLEHGRYGLSRGEAVEKLWSAPPVLSL